MRRNHLILLCMTFFFLGVVVVDSKHLNCTPPAMDDFPSDGFTVEQRRHGWIVIHVLIAIYVIGALAIVCDDYFVPLMHEFSERLGIPTDVAGATFMAFGTSCPELFISLIGAFITEGDIGVGAVIGSAVFNILAIASVCGLFAGTAIQLNWRPLTRDCIVFLIAVGTLLIVIEDEIIYWYEAVIMVIEYLFYILILYFNTRFQKFCRGPLTSYDLPPTEDTKPPAFCIEHYSRSPSIAMVSDLYISIAPHHPQFSIVEISEKIIDTPTNSTPESRVSSVASLKDSATELIQNDLSDSSSRVIEEEEEIASIWTIPRQNKLKLIVWVLWWPVSFLYHFTIPKSKETCCCVSSCFTFVISIVYIGVHSYIAAWMVSVLGNTIQVPDSVMGLTFMAIGSSLPEIVSSVIVSRQSLGNMALSNALGGNVFTLLMCLGVPWLVKATYHSSFVRIYSEGLTYSVLALFLSVIIMFLVMSIHRFRLTKRVGVLCLIMYLTYVVLSCMYEMNVFTQVNLPLC